MLKMINNEIKITNKDEVRKQFGEVYYILVHLNKVVTPTGIDYTGTLHAIADTREEAVAESNRLDEMAVSNLIRKS